MVLKSTALAGAESFVMNVIRSIDKDKFNIDVAVSDDTRGGYADEMKALGCVIHLLPEYRVTNVIDYKKKWTKFFEKNNYDVVHGNLSNSAFLYLDIAKKFGANTIVHSHSGGFRGSFLQRILKRFTSKLAKSPADYWFACSDNAAYSHYGNAYKNYDKFYLIPNGIIARNYRFDKSLRDKVRMQYDLTDDILVVGHVGSFTPPKNHIFLIEIFKEILSLHPSTKLMLIGDGNLRKAIHEKANNLGIKESIIFTGSVSNVNEHMMAMDIMIFPSIFEGLPVSLVESQAAGLKWVASDTITKEVCLSDIASYKSLNDSASSWAEEVLKHTNIENRAYYNDIVCQTDFNMALSIKKLEKIYEESISK